MGSATQIPAFATSARLHEAIYHLIGDITESVASWPRFEARARSSGTALIAIDQLTAAIDTEKFEHLTRSAGWAHFVLLIDDDVVDDDLLGRLTLAKVVRSSRAARLLRPALIELSSHSALAWVADHFAAADQVAPLIRKVVRSACVGPFPVPTINRLAAATGCSRRTVAREWRQSVPPDTCVKLVDLLAWIKLLRALALRPQCGTLKDVARACETSPAALQRYSKRLLAVRFRDLDYGEAMTYFTATIVEPLLESPVPK